VPDELLVLRGVSKTFRSAGWGRAEACAALRDVSLTVSRGEAIAVVGPSGSGKSTLARCAAGFELPDSGEITRRCGSGQIQLIFQQPAASLNPRFRAREVLEEPLVIQKRDRTGAAERAMELVGLPGGAIDRRALEFSGGERQRLAIARALVLEPALLILDESFAGLDGRLQEQMAHLLRELQERLGLAYLLISHDLELVSSLASRLVVMERGAIVEQGWKAEVLAAPRQPLTRDLIEAARVLAFEGGGR